MEHPIMPIPYDWGITPQERSRPFPSDGFLQKPCTPLYRGVSVKAPADILFRWLCQMRVAPYSYDWLDNLGRRSPRKLQPGLDQLAIGQTVLTVFELVAFEPGRHLTLRLRPHSALARAWGECLASYLIVPRSRHACRLLVKLTIERVPGPGHRLLRTFLAWGDLIMMRRQLLTFKCLSEQTPRS
jgi:hypothetical protein